MKKQNNEVGVADSLAAEATPAQSMSIPKWQFTILSTGMVPTEAELAQWRALPGVPLACAAIARYFRDARIQDTTKFAANEIAKLPKLKGA